MDVLIAWHGGVRVLRGVHDEHHRGDSCRHGQAHTHVVACSSVDVCLSVVCLSGVQLIRTRRSLHRLVTGSSRQLKQQQRGHVKPSMAVFACCVVCTLTITAVIVIVLTKLILMS